MSRPCKRVTSTNRRGRARDRYPHPAGPHRPPGMIAWPSWSDDGLFQGGAMPRRVTVVEALELPCPPSVVLPAVWDLKNVERCEVKVERCEVKADAVVVHPRTPQE